MPQSPTHHSGAILEGGCECGRNQYAIYVPSGKDHNDEQPKIVSDGSSWSLRANSQPASIFLRVPLAWLQSTTYAFFPDESPALIRRSYTPHYAPSSKRFFCGICADLLTIWSESSPEDATYAHVNWHTLEIDSREALGGLGILPDETDVHDNNPEGEGEKPSNENQASTPRNHGVDDTSEDRISSLVQKRLRRSGADSPPTVFSNLFGRDMPWFESMLEGSPLGRMRRSTGGGVSSDGRTRIEWEIIEYGGETHESEGQNPQVGSKRRLGDDTDADDVTMR